MAHVVTDQNYEESVQESRELVILDVWASWCMPCRAIDPIVEEVAARAGVVLAKLNVEEVPALAGRIGIGALPTIRLMRCGQILFESVGTLDRTKLEAAVAASAVR